MSVCYSVFYIIKWFIGMVDVKIMR